MNECRTCRFWFKHPNAAPARPIGQCRRHGPVPIMIGLGQDPLGQQQPVINGFFPETRPDIWCGDHEAAVVGNGSVALDLSKLHIEGAQ